eukprot:TRINITY_DN29127_c0_g1_i1.p1 TRINITY_DN29127_c0_g1~~TRINITY_DN29127_c0_g1_i1.p1  ORF type:complete len:710 (-),score=122.80 TRINITY_DN29127_c0_g1_i1:24-2063(-)
MPQQPPRRSLSAAVLQPRAAKQALSSRRRTTLGLVRSVSTAGRAFSAVSSEAVSGEAATPSTPSTTIPEIETEQEADTSDDVNLEVCAICLDPLNDNGFQFPCGQNHRLHYACSVSFIGSILALPLAEDKPGPLTKKEVCKMGTSFKAISILEDAIRRATRESLSRLCCPLCRTEWPTEDVKPLSTVVEELRTCRARELGGQVKKMDEAFSRLRDRFDGRSEVQHFRMAHAVSVLEENFISASSFFANKVSEKLNLCILDYLEMKHVANLSQVSVACERLGRVESKLQARHVKATKIRVATYHVWAQKLVSLQIDPSWGSPAMRSTTGLDAVSFAKWLCNASALMDLTLSNVQWEKVDPGARMLGSSLSTHKLRVIELSQNFMTDGSLISLARVLLDNPSSLANLQSLNFELNCITQAGLAAVLPLGSRPGSRIRDWGFRHNKLGDGACELLSKVFDPEFLPKGPRLDSWDLRTNGIGMNGCKSLVPVVGHMKVLRLGCNPLGDLGVEHLADGFGNSLKILDLRQAKLGDAAAEALGRKMQNTNSLEELLLSGNDIGAMGARSLADGWANVATLRHVDLAGNSSIGSAGVTLLADELPIWKQAPFRLSLAGIGCEEDGAQRLISALYMHPRGGRGWTIELQNNPIGSRCIFEVQRLLEKAPEAPTDSIDDDDDSQSEHA